MDRGNARRAWRGWAFRSAMNEINKASSPAQALAGQSESLLELLERYQISNDSAAGAREGALVANGERRAA